MASVPELLALAQAQQRPNPIASSVQGLLAGVSTAQNESLDRTLKMMKIAQAQRDAAQQAEMNRQIQQQFLQQREGIIQNGHAAIGGAGTPTTPDQKLAVEISQDEKGHYSRKFKLADPKEPDLSFTP